MPNLKQAIERGQLDQFIKAHKREKGDKAQFSAALSAMAGKPSEAPQASPLPDHDD